MQMKLSDLFASKELSDNINSIFNDNSELMFNEMKTEFGLARGKVIQKLISPIFEMFPYRKLFAE